VRSLGLACPDDVAVIGVDDDEVLCHLASPNLTSMNQNLECIGYEAARLLTARRLLADTDFKLAVIAARCGFAHAAQLCTVFKKTFGLTPTEHRRQCEPWTTPPT
jgi:AraC-like DNA-binding protein